MLKRKELCGGGQGSGSKSSTTVGLPLEDRLARKISSVWRGNITQAKCELL